MAELYKKDCEACPGIGECDVLNPASLDCQHLKQDVRFDLMDMIRKGGVQIAEGHPNNVYVQDVPRNAPAPKKATLEL